MDIEVSGNIAHGGVQTLQSARVTTPDKLFSYSEGVKLVLDDRSRAVRKSKSITQSTQQDVWRIFRKFPDKGIHCGEKVQTEYYRELRCAHV